MKCPECGSEINEGEQFCGNCGAPVGTTEQALPDQEQRDFGDETIISEAPVVPEPEPPLMPEEPELAPPLTPEEPELAPPPPLTPAAPPAQDSKKKWIIVAIVVAVLLLCCCCAALVIGLFATYGEEIEDVLDSLAMVAPLLTLV
jgi:hypothetical protein